MRPLLPFLLPAAALAAWFAASESGAVPAYLFPSPYEVASIGFEYLFGSAEQGRFSGHFIDDSAASLTRVFSGFFLATAVGAPLGILSGRLALVREALGTAINSVRAVPGICWLPLAMVWFGIGARTTLFLVALAAFFPIYVNSAAGARQVNPILLEAGAMMGVRNIGAVFRILLPAAMGHVFSGLRLGLGISWAYLVLGELTGVPDGLGAVIMDARMAGRTDMIVAGIIIIAVLGRLSDQLLKSAMRLCFKSVRRMP